LDIHIHGRDVESLEHDLSHSLSVGFRVQRSFGQQDRVFLRSHAELVVKCVMPDLLHIVPVGDDSVLNRILKGKHTSLGLSFITDISVFLIHTHHDSRMLRSADDGREDSSWCVITSETSL
jgi:hypothetical protein